MSTYTRDGFIERLRSESQDMQTFYKASFVNYKGKLNDGDCFYSEVVSDWLLNNMELLSHKHIPMITREKPYKTVGHDGTTERADSQRTEERIALDVKKGNILAPLGVVVDYQTPLKSRLKETKAGKIDLLTYDKANHTLRILELKKPESKETLLRCVLEGYTYYLTANIEKLLADFSIFDCESVKVCPLFFENSNQFKEYKELTEGARPFLHQLMQRLNIEPILLCENGTTQEGWKKYSAQILNY